MSHQNQENSLLIEKIAQIKSNNHDINALLWWRENREVYEKEKSKIVK
jgi:hypothetical protein